MVGVANRDVLFLLKPDFVDGPSAVRYFCPDCAQVEGVLGYFPTLRQSLDVRYVDFQRPRQAIVDLLGESHQGCPVLILDHHSPVSPELVFGQFGEHRFLSGAKAILNYWHDRFGVSKPH